MKIASFVSGDENVFYQGIVTLCSVREYNMPYQMDEFLCVPFDRITEKQRIIAFKHNIKLIDSNLPEIVEYTSRVEPFLKYPKEVFCKYILPVILKKKGYDYCISLDYDVLCVGKYDFSEIIPKNEVCSWRLSGKISKRIKDYIDNIEKVLYVDVDNVYAPNAGFIVYNLREYMHRNFHEKLLEMINIVRSYVIDNAPIDEVAMGILSAKYKLRCIHLPLSYNVTVPFAQPVRTVINLHYCSTPKPWELFRRIVMKQGHHSIVQFLLFNRYLTYISKFEFSKEFNRNMPYSEDEILTYIFEAEDLIKYADFINLVEKRAL